MYIKSDLIGFLADNSVYFSPLNAIMFYGLTALFCVFALLLYIDGIAVYLYSYYEIPAKKWYRRFLKACKTVFAVFSAVYIVTALCFAIGIVQVASTYIAAGVCAFIAAICAALVYYLFFFFFILPFRTIKHLRQKRKR